MHEKTADDKVICGYKQSIIFVSHFICRSIDGRKNAHLSGYRSKEDFSNSVAALIDRFTR